MMVDEQKAIVIIKVLMIKIVLFVYYIAVGKINKQFKTVGIENLQYGQFIM